MPLKIESCLSCGPDMYDPMKDRWVLVGKATLDGKQFGCGTSFSTEPSAEEVQSAWHSICLALEKKATNAN
jgi:hypothetical protein